jgi:hypothetical protein
MAHAAPVDPAARGIGGEVYRYQATRKHCGARCWLVSLAVIFCPQGVLM